MTRKEYDIEIRTNSFGLRDDKIQLKNSGPRILILGDSFTFGFGVERDNIYVDLLERKLGVDVINAGVGGYDIIHQLEWFRHVGKKFEPDLVVYALYLGNDLSRNTEWKIGPHGGLIDTRKKNVGGGESTLKIVEILGTLTYRINYNIWARKEWVPFSDYLSMAQETLPEDAKKNYVLSKRLLGELNDEVVDSGAMFFVFMFPYKTVVDPRAKQRLMDGTPNFERLYDLDRPENEMERYFRSSDIPFYDIIPEMKKYYDTESNEPLFYHYDGHFTKEGHAFVAAWLEPILSRWIGKIERR